MNTKIELEKFAQHIEERTIRGIATGTAALIRSGAIEIGSQLPSVRELAEILGVSPATVSAAWSQLRKQKVIAGTGRNGVWVCGNKLNPHPVRFERIGNFGKHIIADLMLSVPDPQLLPNLAQPLLQGIQVDNLNSYQREPIVPQLEEAVSQSWPYQAAAFLAADGGFDGMHSTLQTLIEPGSVVAIEDPTAARLLDMLDNINAQVVPIACDDEGPLPYVLAEALHKKPAAFIYQPRTHSATGNSVSEQRWQELARLLENTSTLIVEDDGIGELSRHPVYSLGSRFPDRTIHVRSFSKAYGPDLRLAVLSGPKEMIRQIQSFRNFGAGWSSRILQQALAWLLTDAETQQRLEEARVIYAQRRESLRLALANRGLHLAEKDGLSLWLPVPSEQFALITLAARGIAVLPGERCRIGGQQHIRVSTSILLPEQVDTIADALIIAVSGI
ncbi:aminotransferase class I/II-fold pyridoxal phosphate-dependent enzyme [Serratia aquatilis]|uniref:Aminotransferase class I/II-fold pyridoxal phosphate-dependent enzyme n=1 Tax=Serratia aquatilis TaxID=1737515 RepID=A0ABV6EH96_9GAMM